MTLERIPEEQVQLRDFGTGLSGQSSALLVSVSLCCLLLRRNARLEPFLKLREGETFPTAQCAPCRIRLAEC